MMNEITSKYIREMIDGYDKDKLTIATVCSHTSLQIFNGAKKFGVRSLGNMPHNHGVRTGCV